MLVAVPFLLMKSVGLGELVSNTHKELMSFSDGSSSIDVLGYMIAIPGVNKKMVYRKRQYYLYILTQEFSSLEGVTAIKYHLPKLIFINGEHDACRLRPSGGASFEGQRLSVRERIVIVDVDRQGDLLRNYRWVDDYRGDDRVPYIGDIIRLCFLNFSS